MKSFKEYPNTSFQEIGQPRCLLGRRPFRCGLTGFCAVGFALPPRLPSNPPPTTPLPPWSTYHKYLIFSHHRPRQFRNKFNSISSEIRIRQSLGPSLQVSHPYRVRRRQCRSVVDRNSFVKHRLADLHRNCSSLKGVPSPRITST